MADGDAHVFSDFLRPILTQLSFQSHGLLFSHALEVRGEKYPRRKVCLNRVSNSQPPGHESHTLTNEPPGRIEEEEEEEDEKGIPTTNN